VSTRPGIPGPEPLTPSNISPSHATVSSAVICPSSAWTAIRCELVGNFKNPGRWESTPRGVYDHDFRTDSTGVAIPDGIYDVTENRGALVVGVPTIPPPLPLMPSLIGGARKVPPAIAVHVNCSFWPIPAAATVAGVTPGKPSPIPMGQLFCPGRNRSPPVLPNGIPSSIASSLKSHATGRANRWILTRRSSTMPVPPKPKPDRGSLPVSTVDTIRAVSNPHQIKLPHFDCSAMKLCPMELHYQATIVNLFLLDPLVDSSNAPFPIGLLQDIKSLFLLAFFRNQPFSIEKILHSGQGASWRAKIH